MSAKELHQHGMVHHPAKPPVGSRKEAGEIAKPPKGSPAMNYDTAKALIDTDKQCPKYIEKFSDIYFEPRISFSQRFLSNFRIELLGELKSQTTSQIIDLQNDFLGVEKRRWVLSNNEDIPIIKSNGSSIILTKMSNIRLLIQFHIALNNFLILFSSYGLLKHLS